MKFLPRGECRSCEPLFSPITRHLAGTGESLGPVFLDFEALKAVPGREVAKPGGPCRSGDCGRLRPRKTESRGRPSFAIRKYCSERSCRYRPTERHNGDWNRSCPAWTAGNRSFFRSGRTEPCRPGRSRPRPSKRSSDKTHNTPRNSCRDFVSGRTEYSLKHPYYFKCLSKH